MIERTTLKPTRKKALTKDRSYPRMVFRIIIFYLISFLPKKNTDLLHKIILKRDELTGREWYEH